MKRNIFILIFFFNLIVPAFAVVGHNYSYHPDNLESMVGTIQGRSRNTIDILDEQDKRIKHFIEIPYQDNIHPGDHVRLYYRPDNLYVQRIKKIQPVEYKKDGQNLGYILK